MTPTRTEQFDGLVAPHMPMLYRVAYRLVRNAHDAQDLVQDTCVAACENPALLGAAEHPRRWLLRVLHNRFIDGDRRNRKVPFVGLEESDAPRLLASDRPGPEELLQQADDERAFEHAFLQLDPVHRTLLALRAEGHGLGEMESITGIAREALRSRLHRASRTLAQKLNESGASLPAARTGSKS
jgi:RNA polymerase sigma-70 factor, ECF subfamily